MLSVERILLCKQVVLRKSGNEIERLYYYCNYYYCSYLVTLQFGIWRVSRACSYDYDYYIITLVPDLTMSM